MQNTLESAVQLWEYFFPTPLTPEQKIDQACASIKKQENVLKREEWAVKARMERADQELAKTTKTRNKAEMERAARSKVAVENQRSVLHGQLTELNATKEGVMRMQTDQIGTRATLDVMAATNEISVDPQYAIQTIFRFQQTSLVRDEVNTLVKETMEARREEQEEANAEQAEADKERIEELMTENWHRANSELSQEMPYISVHSKLPPPPMASGSPKEMARQNRDGQRRLDLFLSSSAAPAK